MGNPFSIAMSIQQPPDNGAGHFKSPVVSSDPVTSNTNINTKDGAQPKKEPPPEKPSDIRRRSYIILSFWLIVVLLGLPIWWKTTTIYRADLPLQEMLDWSDGKVCIVSSLVLGMACVGWLRADLALSRSRLVDQYSPSVSPSKPMRFKNKRPRTSSASHNTPSTTSMTSPATTCGCSWPRRLRLNNATVRAS